MTSADDDSARERVLIPARPGVAEAQSLVLQTLANSRAATARGAVPRQTFIDCETCPSTEPVSCAVCRFRHVLGGRGATEYSLPIVVLKHGFCKECYGWLIHETATLGAGHLLLRAQDPLDWR
jgi:hypothetical protein